MVAVRGTLGWVGYKEGTEGCVWELSVWGVLGREQLPGSRCQACFRLPLLGFMAKLILRECLSLILRE